MRTLDRLAATVLLAPLVSLAALASLVTGCATTLDAAPVPGPEPAPHPAERAANHDALTPAELARATALARAEAEREDAHLTSASVVARRGTVRQPNTGQACSPGRLLHLRLVGSFPHIVTTGTPGGASGAGDVHAVLLTADAATGRACLIGVTPREIGPAPGSTPIAIR